MSKFTALLELEYTVIMISIWDLARTSKDKQGSPWLIGRDVSVVPYSVRYSIVHPSTLHYKATSIFPRR